jgi:CRP/FNR family transcriptional regulator
MSDFSQAEVMPQLDAGHPCLGCAARDLSMCSVLGAEELRDLRHCGGTAALAKGKALFFEGDDARNVYNVISGVLRLSKLLPDGRRQVTGFMFPGDFLGITLEDEHAFTVEAVTGSELCRFSRAQFEDFLLSHSKLERRLYTLAAHELAAARQQLVLLGRKTASERLASFILELSNRQGRSGTDDTVVELPMSRTDIADYLGLRIETVSREFTVLKTTGLIRLLGTHELRILDRHALQALSEG